MISPGYPVEIVVNQAVFMVYHLVKGLGRFFELNYYLSTWKNDF